MNQQPTHTHPGVAILTGASGGMGRVIATTLSAQGYDLVLTDRAPGLWAEDLPSSTYVQGDIADAAVVQKVLDGAAAFTADRWTVIAAAGTSKVLDYLEPDQKLWDDTRAVNLDATYGLVAAAAKAMVDGNRHGSIVMISSIAYLSGGANPAYGAAKAGLNTLAYGYAQALGPHGITVNAVAPGIIATPMVVSDKSPEEFAEFEAIVSTRIPARRLGTPADVAGVVAFLASDQSRYVTGTVIPVTGGIELLPPFGTLFAQASAAYATGQSSSHREGDTARL